MNIFFNSVLTLFAISVVCFLIFIVYLIYIYHSGQAWYHKETLLDMAENLPIGGYVYVLRNRKKYFKVQVIGLNKLSIFKYDSNENYVEQLLSNETAERVVKYVDDNVVSDEENQYSLYTDYVSL